MSQFPCTGSKRILLVDDESSVLRALTLLLQALGHTVTEYSGGSSALKALNEGLKVDIMICDLKMPEMDGLEVIAKVKKIQPELPSVLMSAHATSEEVKEAEKLGIVGFLGKPFTPDQLTKMVNEVAR